jgi:uncharacterized protein YbjT (DUF2867 family)
MKRILITGATGNVGVSVISFLSKNVTTLRPVAGVRDVDKAKKKFTDIPDLEYAHFDFENPDTFSEALKNIDRVFLLRPPHLADVEKYFRPLMIALTNAQIREIIFLSVQGAEKSRIIPHNKIEKLIKEFDLEYIFVRPSYFMQNLTTTFLPDIQTKRKIILPAGKAEFNLVDIENIGEASAILSKKFQDFKNRAFEITGNENKSFYRVSEIINSFVSKPVEYKSVNPFKFYSLKKSEGIPKGKILVMIMLHFSPRFRKQPKLSNAYEMLTDKKPTSLKEFVQREKEKFE